MSVRSVRPSRFRSVALSVVGALVVGLGITSVPLAATAADALPAPIVIDDFAGKTLGTRTQVVEAANSSANFVPNDGTGVGVIALSGSGPTTGRVTLKYTFAEPIDLTSKGNNSQFMVALESVRRPGIKLGENAVSATITATGLNAGGVPSTGVFNTGYAETGAFNQVMNFAPTSAGGASFTPQIEFTRVTELTVSFAAPSNYDGRVTTVRIADIRTTPAGGAQPPAPSTTITAVGTSPLWHSGSASIDYDISFTRFGEAAGLATELVADKLSASTTGTLTASRPTLAKTATGYRATISVSGEGTFQLNVPANAVTDTWGQGSFAGAGPVTQIRQGSAPAFPADNPTYTIDAVVGVPFSQQLTATGTPTPTYALQSSAIAGVQLSESGVLTGTPTAAGTFPLTIAADNALGSTIASVVVIVSAGGFTSPDTVTFKRGEPVDFSVTWAGVPNGTVTWTDSLPPGLSVEDNTTFASFTGTPQTAGDFTATFTLSRVGGGAITQTLKMTVSEPPVITSLPTFEMLRNQPTANRATATGWPAATFTHSGPLPTGLTLLPDGSFSGSPTALPGSYPVRLTAENSAGRVDQDVVIVVGTVPTATADKQIRVAVGAEFALSLGVAGSPAPEVTTSLLPSWITLGKNANGQWQLVAAPTEKVATAAVTVTVTNAFGSLQRTHSFESFVPAGITGPETLSFEVGEPITPVFFPVAGDPVPVVESTLSIPGLEYVITPAGVTLSGTPRETGEFAFAITATKYSGFASKHVNVTVTEAPRIEAPASYDGSVGDTIDHQITVFGYPAPTLTATDLPPGLSLVALPDGTYWVRGTLAGGGGFLTTFTATSGSQVNTATWRVEIYEPAQFPVLTHLTFANRSAVSFDYAVSGYPIPRLTATGLPSGLVNIDHGDGTATITGTPGTAGVVRFELHAEQSPTGTVTRPATMTITELPVFTTPDHAEVLVHEPMVFEVHATGVPAILGFSVAASPIPGVTIHNDGGALSFAGTPTETGTYRATINAASTIGTTEQSFSLTVGSRPTISAPESVTTLAGDAVSLPLTVTGYPTPTVTSSALPAGLRIETDVSGKNPRIVGTPTVAGTWNITFAVENIFGTAQATGALNIHTLPAFTSPASAVLEQGVLGSITVATEGYPAATIAAVDLPDGLVLSSSTDGTATISGTATEARDHLVRLTASNGTTPATQELTIRVTSTPAITVPASASLPVGVPAEIVVTSTGFPIPTLSATGLPAGMSFTDNEDGTGVLAGTPTERGSATVTFTSANENDTVSSQTTIAVTEEPTFTSPNTATVGADFTFATTATGFPEPTITATGLPAGVTFADGVLTGAAVAGGEYVIALQASNDIAGAVRTADQTFTLTVIAAPQFTSPGSVQLPVGEPTSTTITTSGFPAAAITAGTLPEGLTFTDAGDGTATISGTPTVTATTAITLTATNDVGTATHTLFVTATSPTSFLSGSVADFREGEAGSFTIQTTGFPLAALSLGGTLPAGLSFTDNADGTATIAGTPTGPGTSTVTVSATRPPQGAVLRSMFAIAANAEAPLTQTITIMVAEKVVQPTEPTGPTGPTPIAPPAEPQWPETALPATGSATPAAAPFALMLMLLGAGAMLIARRRTRQG